VVQGGTLNRWLCLWKEDVGSDEVVMLADGVRPCAPYERALALWILREKLCFLLHVALPKLTASIASHHAVERDKPSGSALEHFA
jgi:hypothetical protein